MLSISTGWPFYSMYWFVLVGGWVDVTLNIVWNDVTNFQTNFNVRCLERICEPQYWPFEEMYQLPNGLETVPMKRTFVLRSCLTHKIVVIAIVTTNIPRRHVMCHD